MATGRGRPRRAPYSLTTRHGYPCLRIYLPGGAEARVRVPAGWEPDTTFRAWLQDFREHRPDLALPDPWKLYATAEGAPRLPGRAQLPPVARVARAAHAADVIAAPAAGTRAAPVWEEAVAAFVQALRDGWHPPHLRAHARGPASVPKVAAALRAHGRRYAWASPAALDRAALHAWTTAEEQRPTRTGFVKVASIKTHRSYLKNFVLWCRQCGYDVPDPHTWPNYGAGSLPREARATGGDVDLALPQVPYTFRKGAPCRVLLLLMRYTGLRWGDLAGLPRAAFRLDADPPHIDAPAPSLKARKPRRLPLNQPCIDALCDWFSRRDYGPSDLPFGKRRRDGSIRKWGDPASWNRLLDRLGIPRNADDTGGMHRIRKAAFSEILDRPGPAAGGPEASFRAALGLAGVTPLVLDSYYRRMTLAELDPAKLVPPSAHGRPLQLSFMFSPTGAVSSEVRHEDGHIDRVPEWPLCSEQRRRAFALVRDTEDRSVTRGAIASDGNAAFTGQVPGALVLPGAWRKKGSGLFRPRRRSTVAGRGRG